MTDHPIRRLARLLREASDVLHEQHAALQARHAASPHDWRVADQLKYARADLGRLRVHAGACLGLLILADDPDAFRPEPTPEEHP